MAMALGLAREGAVVARDHGRLDILVNNAGVGAFGPIGAVERAKFDRLLAINMRAVLVAS